MEYEVENEVEYEVEITPSFIEAVKQYNELNSFSEGLAPVKKNGKWGFINTKGDLVIPCEYDFAYSFSNGVALVELNNKYGYIDKYGNSTFSETGIALAKIKEERKKGRNLKKNNG